MREEKGLLTKKKMNQQMVNPGADIVRIHTYIHTHTHTYIYIYTNMKYIYIYIYIQIYQEMP